MTEVIKFSLFKLIIKSSLTFFLCVMTSFSFSDQKIKEPNVSGQFYDSNPQKLTAQLNTFLNQADVEPVSQRIEVIIAPHAGYVYSGAVAGYGFKAVRQANPKTVIILAPSHFVGFDGISVWEEGGFQTPLGIVEVDQEIAKQMIAADDKISFYPQAFAREHSLEVEIPFIQNNFEGVKIVPIIMGQPSFGLLDKFAEQLTEIMTKRDDILIVVSTDLSHYHDDATARKMDRQAITAIEKLQAKEIFDDCQIKKMEMCGFVPVTAAVLYAQKRGLDRIKTLKYANSGDVTGDSENVVGYASIIMHKSSASGTEDQTVSSDETTGSGFTLEQKRRLIEIARSTMTEYIKTGKILEFQNDDPRLNEEEGSFVTINKHGQLRGCMGNVLGSGPLYLTVRDMAITSSTKDPRFPSVSEEELKDIHIEVSVLSKPRVIKDASEIELGKHGVIVSRGLFNRGLFLPQVADSTGWSKEEFLSQLCAQKAGLSPDAWKDPQTKLEVFTAEVFDEGDVK